MAKRREIIWADGKVVLGTEPLPDTIAFSVDIDPKVVTHKQGEGGGDIQFPVGKSVKGKVTWNALSPELYALLTGGTQTDGSTYTTVRRGEEGPHTCAVQLITLTNGAGAKILENTVEIFRADGTAYKKVASGSEVAGESYSYVAATGVCTFDAADNDEDFYPQYSYADATGGSKVTLGKHDVPSQMELWGRMRTKDVNSLTGAKSDMFVHLSKVNIITGLSLGAEDAENTKSNEVEFSAIIDDASDFEVYFGTY